MARLILSLALVAATACAGTAPGTSARWDVEGAEILRWTGASEDFAQDRAIEVSGLTASPHFIYAVSEKYAAVLQIAPKSLEAVVLHLDVPEGSELEGVAWADGRLFICDERYAFVYELPIADEMAVRRRAAAEVFLPRTLHLHNIDIEPGKTGVEGIVVVPDGSLYLALERVFLDGGCVSRIFHAELDGDRLVGVGEPITIPLEDCNWRLAGLAAHGSELLAIKSQYPGERYRILTIDPAAGSSGLALDITAFGRSLRSRGHGNNIEGITLDREGGLLLVTDNADTPGRRNAAAPEAREATAFLRIPKQQ